MQQRGTSEVQKVSTKQGVTSPPKAQEGASSAQAATESLPRPMRGRGAPLWAWLVLGILLVPGAWSSLSEEQEELLVELHNHYRGQVSPSASAMLPLKWDPNLKVLAEGYTAKCIWNHNPELEDTGENLYAGTGPLDLHAALEKWFLERLSYDFHNNSCDEDKMCGHYTQMVWSDTHRVGCAFHLCDHMEGLTWEKVSYLVCNYYPAGNYEGERPYVEGDSCSSCPEKVQKCENNLCVPELEEDEGEGVEEESTVLPPLETSEPAFLPEEEEGEEGVLPPATTESFLPEDTSTTPRTSTTTSTTSTPAPSQDLAAPNTPPPRAPPPKVLTTAQREEEAKKEAESTKEAELADKGGKERAGKERRIKVQIFTIKDEEIFAIQANSASSPSPSLMLLSCLTFILLLLAHTHISI